MLHPISLAFLVLCPSSLTQSARLNGALARVGNSVRGDVTSFEPALGAGRVVYRADQEFDEVFGLYSARLDLAAGPVHLTASLTASGSVSEDYEVSPDGAWVAFEHAPAVEEPGSLYLVSTRGETPPLELDRDARFFSSSWSVVHPNRAPHPTFAFANGRLVYLRVVSPGYATLCSVPLDGSSEALVLAAPAEFFGVQEFLLSPDGTRVFYRGDDEVAGRGSQLYVVPVDGSLAPRRLDLDRVANSYGVRSFSIAPDGRHLVYALGSEGLFSVQLDPLRAPKRLHNPLSAAAEAQDHAITSDSRRVVYLGHGRVAGRYRLYSAPIDGRRPPHADVNGTPEVDPDQLTPMPHFGDVNRSQPFSLTADGQYAVYVADARVDGFQELFRVRTDGTTAPDLLSRDGDEIVQFAISADDAHVVYRSYSPSGTGIYRTPLAGGEPVKFDIDPPAAPEAFQVAPDDSFVFFSASSNAPGRRELMAVPFDASRPARSMGASFPADWRLLFGFQALPGGRALFRLNEPFEVFELYEAFAGRTRPAPR